MLTPTAPGVGMIEYAAPRVPTHRRRTPLGTLARLLRRAGGLALLLVRLVFLAAGYAVIFAGVVLRLGCEVAGAILLFLGGLRWEVVRSRLMRSAEWVDAQTLRTVRLVTRNPFALKPAEPAPLARVVPAPAAPKASTDA